MVTFENDHDRISFEFGAVARLLAFTNLRTLDLGSLEAQVIPPLRLRQRIILFNKRQLPIAYASWAYVTEAVAAELTHSPARPLHLSEWNEGTILWLVDFVAPEGRAIGLARELRERLAGSHAFAHSVRYDRSLYRPVRVRLSERSRDCR